jgi:hypothetical protein
MVRTKDIGNILQFVDLSRFLEPMCANIVLGNRIEGQLDLRRLLYLVIFDESVAEQVFGYKAHTQGSGVVSAGRPFKDSCNL